MTIEKLIEDNTKAITALTVVLQNFLAANSTLPVAEKPKRVKKDKPVETIEGADESSDAPVSVSTATSVAEAKIQEAASTVDYTHLAVRIKTLVALGSEGRAEAVKILSNNGVNNAKELKPAQYENVLMMVEKAIKHLDEEDLA